ncbi:hypothetical protein [Glaciecola petra]|uniref:DUF4397 domain-containing protein n=1 Tax=Glaciecola petra TaxID=3075602 RepID=A0ABU2ZUP7_9ALTE|nr:hypothetical protein [Aestuariibacter sp. P117]MDT0596367.1 hypothetical protein [Aestuariibacter sp. P117]
MFLAQKQAHLWKPIFVSVLLLSLIACSGSSDDEDATGYIKFYNASADSPAIFMTIDEDIDSDADDEIERTLSGVSYASAGTRTELETQSYYLELAWQDEDSSARTDLEIVYESQIDISEDETQWVIMTGSVQSPTVNIYSIPELDEDELSDDQDDDLFTLRVINLHQSIVDVDIYLSLEDETFNEAELLVSAQADLMTEKLKREQDQYKVYITQSGQSEVLFSSEDISFVTGVQYLLALRENQGVGGSEFVVDNITSGQITSYEALESLANLTIYNGLNSNDLLPSYMASVNLSIDGKTTVPSTADLSYSEFSDAFELESSDYRLSVFNNNTDEVMLQNRLISAPQNADRTVFLYWTDEAVDDDGDGDVDENDDGIIDEIRPIVSTLTVENSNLSRFYDKQVTMLNLLNTDTFSRVTFYFVKSDEIIDTAENTRSLLQGTSSNMVLLNNTYQLFVVTEIDNNDIILHESTLVLDQESDDLFLLLEESESSASGYAVRVESQKTTSNDE